MGNVIQLARPELFVTEACSGLRSLTALLSMAVLTQCADTQIAAEPSALGPARVSRCDRYQWRSRIPDRLPRLFREPRSLAKGSCT